MGSDELFSRAPKVRDMVVKYTSQVQRNLDSLKWKPPVNAFSCHNHCSVEQAKVAKRAIYGIFKRE